MNKVSNSVAWAICMLLNHTRSEIYITIIFFAICSIITFLFELFHNRQRQYHFIFITFQIVQCFRQSHTSSLIMYCRIRVLSNIVTIPAKLPSSTCSVCCGKQKQVIRITWQKKMIFTVDWEQKLALLVHHPKRPRKVSFKQDIFCDIIPPNFFNDECILCFWCDVRHLWHPWRGRGRWW